MVLGVPILKHFKVLEFGENQSNKIIVLVKIGKPHFILPQAKFLYIKVQLLITERNKTNEILNSTEFFFSSILYLFQKISVESFRCLLICIEICREHLFYAKFAIETIGNETGPMLKLMDLS